MPEARCGLLPAFHAAVVAAAYRKPCGEMAVPRVASVTDGMTLEMLDWVRRLPYREIQSGPERSADSITLSGIEATFTLAKAAAPL